MPKTMIAILFTIMALSTASAHPPIAGSSVQDPQAADQNDDSGPIKVGYAIITPTSDTAAPLLVFESFGFRLGTVSVQAGVLPASMTTTGLLFANTSDRLLRNLGVAIANPGELEARVNFTLRRDDGIVIGLKTIFVPPRWQSSRFVTEIFADSLALPSEITGTLSFTSNTPIAVVGLRFRNETFSTEPVMNTSDPVSIPLRPPGVGGNRAVILPQFAVGGGWSTEFVIVNSGSATVFVRLDLFGPDGSPLAATMNGTTASTFLNIRILPGGVVTVAPRDSNGDSRF